tara:strand:- start:1780 stop:2229 length:450 start_codon:yes stop_codon:yes gene_type:complete
MMLLDGLAIMVNSVGWGIKPVLEKISVKKIGHVNFSYIRYIITGIISLILLSINLYRNGIGKKFHQNPNYLYDALKWGTIVSVVALVSIVSNYYLLSKYDVSYIAPIVEGALLVMNALFGIIFLKEKITTQAIGGIATIIVGTFILYSS